MLPVKHIHEYRIEDRAGLRRLGTDLRDLHEPPYIVTVHPYSPGPTFEQRALWKIWMKGLAEDTGYTQREVENTLLAIFGPTRDFINEHGELERRPARFNAREMTYQDARELMLLVEAYMGEFGFILQARRDKSDPTPAVVFRPMDGIHTAA